MATPISSFGNLPVDVNYGGTGLTSYTTGDLLYASGSTTIASLADVATGNALISGGTSTAPSYGKIGLTTHVTGTLPAANGGTGISSYTIGDIIYASGSTALSALSDVATGNALISGGTSTAPSWGKIGMTTHVSGILQPANGGTGNGNVFSNGSIVFIGPSGGGYNQNNANLFWDNSSNIFKANSQAIIGTDTSTSKASIGLTLASSQNNTFSTNNDMTDGLRQLTLYNVSTNTNNYCAYTWRVGTLTLDSKFVKTASTTSSVYWTFYNGSAADQYVWDSAGNAYIGTTLRIGTLSGSATSPLDVTTSSARTVTSYGFLNSSGTTGTGASSGSQQFSGAFSARLQCGGEIDVTSDIREKEIIDYPNDEILFNAVNEIIPIHFTWKYRNDNHIKLGVSAQQLIDCIPEAVTGDVGEINGIKVDDKLTVNYNQIVVACIGAIQHLAKKVELLENKLKD